MFSYKKNRAWAENLSIVMQLGLTMAGCIFLCFLLGRSLDKLIGTKGIFIMLFTLFGIIGGANVTYRQIIEVLKEEKEENQPEDENN